MKTCIGIISWLPDSEEVRSIRLKRLKNLIYKCRINMDNLHIFIIAQNWDHTEFKPRKYMTVYYYDKLGITGAREELRKKFLESDYDYMLCLDDDFELTDYKNEFDNYLKIATKMPGKLTVHKNYLMNLCVVSRYIAEKYPFDTTISAEDGTGFEDWIWVSVIENREPTRVMKLNNFKLAARERKELVNDEYSTWIGNCTNKDELTKKSKELIDKFTKK